MSIHTYTLVNAFTTSPTAGNPAAVILLPASPVSPKDLVDAESIISLYPPLETLVRAARELDQPMTAFAIPLTSTADDNPNPDTSSPGVYALRWINPKGEVMLCGHASMALSWSLLIDHPTWESVEYHTVSHGIVRARRLKDASGSGNDTTVRVALDFPALTDWTEIQPETERYKELMRLVSHATDGKWDENAVLALIDSPGRIMVEVVSDFDLKGLELDSHKLAQIAPANLIITQVVDPSTLTKSDETEHVRSRVFNTIPSFEHEDHVTGSAHCLIIPYLLTHPPATQRLSTTMHSGSRGVAATDANDYSGVRVKVHQVSERGGRLVGSWRREEGSVRLEGTCVRVGGGEVEV